VAAKTPVTFRLEPGEIAWLEAQPGGRTKALRGLIAQARRCERYEADAARYRQLGEDSGQAYDAEAFAEGAQEWADVAPPR